MTIDIFNLCAVRLPELLKNKQVGNKKYIFVVDQQQIAEAIISFGYSVTYISSVQEQAEIIDILVSANMFANNCIIVGCCSKSVNKAISEVIGDRFIDTGWKIYKSQKEYYILHSDELKNEVEAFVRNLENPPNPDKSDKPIGTGKNIDYKNIALTAIEEFDIVMLDGELRKHKEGRVYSSYTEFDNDDLLIGMLENSKKKDRAEIFPYIRKYAPKKTLTKGIIPFLNGVYDLELMKLKPYTDNMYFTSCIPHNYNENAIIDDKGARMADSFFKAVSCDDVEVEKLLIDIIAYCFVPGNPWQKMFFTYGSGGNGKGTYFSLLTNIFGADKVEFKTWEDLSSKNGRASIIDKLIVLCNDINNTYLKEPQALKTLISCEPQTIKLLYQNEFTATFNGKIISSGNVIPRVNDTSNGWQRRLILIPFDADFRSNPDTRIINKLTEEPVIEYIVSKALSRLPKVLTEGFETPSKVKALIEEYRLDNNPVAQFITEYGDNFRGKNNCKTLQIIYDYYRNFCSENGYSFAGKNTFCRLAKAEGLKETVDSRGYRFKYVD